MKNRIVHGVILAFTVLTGAPVLGQKKLPDLPQVSPVADQRDTYGVQLGTVKFPVSCSESARQHAERGLALLHHMTYEGARTMFSAAIEADPDCAAGYWGKAMSFIHPLWSDPPSEANFARGKALVNLAKTRGQKTDWEQAYLAAVEAYYSQGRNSSEKVNLASFEQGWENVYLQFPK